MIDWRDNLIVNGRPKDFKTHVREEVTVQAKAHECVFAYVDTTTRLIYSIFRSIGGEIEFVYGEEMYRCIEKGNPLAALRGLSQARVISSSEIKELIFKREVHPIRSVYSIEPVFFHEGKSQWELVTKIGEVFTT